MNNFMTVKETEKYLREELTKMGLTLKVHKLLKINGCRAYYVNYRHSNDTIIENCTLGFLLINFESGYIHELKAE